MANAAPSVSAPTGSLEGVIAPRSPWIRGPLWDLGLLSFGWVPFYLLFVFRMHLGEPGVALARRPEFKTAVAIVLALIFAHRHYVFLMVFGDARAFSARPRAFVGSAVAIVGATALAWAARDAAPSVWTGVVVLGVVWNIWHSIMQRYGIARIYAGKAGAGLEAGAHAAREKRLVWSAVLLLSAALIATRAASLEGHPSGRAVLRVVQPLLDSRLPTLLLAAAALLFAGLLGSWGAAELRAEIPLRDRIPRLAFLASTFVLLLITYVYGPIVGFLVFASAHGVEYIAFVHHFAARAYANRTDAFAARILRNPLRSALAIVPASFFFYIGMRTSGYTLLGAFVVYEVSFAMVHFLYDGWVWKARSPALRKPLELA